MAEINKRIFDEQRIIDEADWKARAPQREIEKVKHQRKADIEMPLSSDINRALLKAVIDGDLSDAIVIWEKIKEIESKYPL